MRRIVFVCIAFEPNQPIWWMGVRPRCRTVYSPVDVRPWNIGWIYWARATLARNNFINTIFAHRLQVKKMAELDVPPTFVRIHFYNDNFHECNCVLCDSWIECNTLDMDFTWFLMGIWLIYGVERFCLRRLTLHRKTYIQFYVGRMERANAYLLCYIIICVVVSISLFRILCGRVRTVKAVWPHRRNRWSLITSALTDAA